jgi:hypothetical protein
MSLAHCNPHVGPSLRWVYEGQKLWAPIGIGFVLCEVVCAAGTRARVHSARFDVVKWVEVNECFEFKETYH